MLYITLPKRQAYDEETESVIILPEEELVFEHSLKSLSEWEAKYCRPFLTSEKTNEEALDYCCMMCVTRYITIDELNADIIKEINEYLESAHTATTVNASNDGNSRTIMTSEVIYAYMANSQVPFTCDEWNLQNLLKVIEVIGTLNGPKKEKSRSEIMQENRRINEMRRAKYNTKG